MDIENKKNNTAKQIDPQTLISWIEAKREMTILDIRPISDFDEWHIPESIHVNVYDELKSGKSNIFDHLTIDPNIPIVTVCGRGQLSILAADLLSQKVINAYSLTGGMLNWNKAYDTQEIDFGTYKIIQLRRVAKGCLSYMIGSNNIAMVIDSSLDPKIYKDIASKEGWEIKYAADTHIHADYVSRTIDLVKDSNAIHLFNAEAEVYYPFTPIKDDDTINLGHINIKVMFSPGHTLESTSFIISDGAVVTGDTLFLDGIGRPDLKADQSQMVEKSKILFHSLQNISSLDEELLVMPAHSSKSIYIGQPFITENIRFVKQRVTSMLLSENEFIHSICSNLPPTPPNYLKIVELNKNGSYDNYDLAELEAGANRCAIQR